MKENDCVLFYKNNMWILGFISQVYPPELRKEYNTYAIRPINKYGELCICCTPYLALHAVDEELIRIEYPFYQNK